MKIGWKRRKTWTTNVDVRSGQAMAEVMLDKGDVARLEGPVPEPRARCEDAADLGDGGQVPGDPRVVG